MEKENTLKEKTKFKCSKCQDTGFYPPGYYLNNCLDCKLGRLKKKKIDEYIEAGKKIKTTWGGIYG